MPIYEFFCKECNTVYKFFSRKIDTEKIPDCPKKMNHHLERRIPLVAVLSGKRKDTSGEDDMPPIDEAKMEKAMNLLAREADKINEDDPRQAAQLMKKLSHATGLNLGAGMEEALSRMEKGEDPEKIEEEMGDLLEGEEPFSFDEKTSKISNKSKPKIDDTLYDM
jgi:hypothetical protein